MDGSRKVAWFFPGQGSQEVGMGKAVADAYASARLVFERADRALAEPLSELCFEGPIEKLTLTANTQPALVTTCMAIAAAIRERWPELPQPAFAAGHSLGEYSALVAAGALDIEDAVRLSRFRGTWMQEAVPPGEGAMAAIMGLDAGAVSAICAEAADGQVVSPANFNAPGQIVIAGHADAVARASALVGERKGKAVPLKVSAPFHCALMKGVADKLDAELSRIRMGGFAFPVVANFDARPNADPARVRELLVRQIDGAVQWVRTVEWMGEQGVTHALEIGPGKVLSGLCKRITKSITVLSVGDPEAIERVGPFMA